MIKIATRFHPFSHTPGSTCLLPNSFWLVQAFPTLLVFENLHTHERHDVALDLQGPVKNFTLEQDLERGEIFVFGQSLQGHFRLRIARAPQGIRIFFEKSRKEILLPVKNEPMRTEVSQERLSLGMHKAQDWDLVMRRQDLKEILPIWLRLAQLLPELPDDTRTFGTLTLLQECEELLVPGKTESLVPCLHKAILAGFRSMLVPRLIDDQYQGLVQVSTEAPKNLSPLLFLKRGSDLIRAFFFQERADGVALLPHLPPEFFAGRFVNIQRKNGDEIDLEWSKKMLRRVIIRANVDQELTLHLQKPIRTFRLRKTLRERGSKIQRGQTIALRAGETLLLDRFEK